MAEPVGNGAAETILPPSDAELTEIFADLDFFLELEEATALESEEEVTVDAEPSAGERADDESAK